MDAKFQYTKQHLISDLNTYRKSFRVDPDDQIIMVQSSREEAAFPHNHEFCELVYIQAGRGVHVVN